MVKILSNGEIVSDDDPRAQGKSQSSGSSRQTSPVQRRVVYANEFNNDGGRAQENFGRANPVSLFDSLNGRLLNFGIPRWNLGSFVVEPIYSVALLLMLLMFGLPGILMVFILFVVSQLSRPNAGSLGQLYNNMFGQQTTGDAASQRRTPSNRPTNPDGDASGGKSNFAGQGNRLGK